MANRNPGLLRQILRVCQPLYKPMIVALPLIALNRGASLALPFATKVLVDDILVSRRVDLLWMFLAAMVAAALVQGATVFGIARILGSAHEGLVAAMRSRLQAHIVSLPLRFHESTKTGSLIASIMIDTEGFSKLFSSGVGDTGAAVLGALVAFAFLVHIEPILASGALVLVVTHTLLSQQLGRRVLVKFQDHRRTKAEVVGRLMETLAGVRLVKVYNAERHESEAFRAGAWQVCRQYVAATLHSEALRAVSLTLTGVGTATLLYFGASKVLAGELTIGGLVAFSGALALLVAPINQVAGLVGRLPQALAEVERTLKLLAEPSESATGRHACMPRIRGTVTFDRVSFAYLPPRTVLHGVSFEAEAGAVIAFVGASGAGKSTVAALVASLYEPTEGRILVDGIDLSTVSFASYRSQVGMVLQDTFLFDGSILENVAFSHRDVPESKIAAACRIARVAEFAERLPEGYQTIVGERGVRLSGGERQRIAIARALLIDPRILILDEPTSSLDYDVEEGIVASLKELIAGRTTFIISHRPALIEIAERVLFVDNGRLVDESTRLDGRRRAGRHRGRPDAVRFSGRVRNLWQGVELSGGGSRME